MTDSRITVRFYTVVLREAGQPSFEASLKKLISFGENPAREVDETSVQASSLALNGKRISGDLIRLQTENFPSLLKHRAAPPTKLTLEKGAGLGHHAAFLYDAATHVLAYQIANHAVPLGLFNRFISVACECDGYGFLPVISASELKQLNRITPKTLLIKVADPYHLDAVEDEHRKLRRSLQNLRDLADGMYIKVQIGLANNKRQLNKARLGNIVGWLLEQRDLSKGKIGTVQVIGKDSMDGDIELDFIRAQLGESKTLALGEAGQGENYNTRAAFLLECMETHHKTLNKFKHRDDDGD